MNFTEIDMSVRNRTGLFRYDIDRLRVVMSLTVDINMTPLPELNDRKNLNSPHHDVGGFKNRQSAGGVPLRLGHAADHEHPPRDGGRLSPLAIL